MPSVVHSPDRIVDGATIPGLRVALVCSVAVPTTTARVLEPLGVRLDVTFNRPLEALDRALSFHRASPTPRRLPLHRILSP